MRDEKADDVLIIGGGVIGVAAAYFLTKAGRSVTLIDKGEIASGSSYGNAGLLCPCHSTPLPAPGVLTQGIKWLFDAASPFYIKPRLDADLFAWLWRFQSFCNQDFLNTAVPLLRDMQRASLDLYQELIATEKLDCDFIKQGGLALYRTERGFAHAQHEVELMQRFGLQMKLLDQAEVRERVTAVHPNVIGGVHYQEDAHVTPDLFVRGLAKAAVANGATILTDTELLGFEQDGGERITAVNSTRGTFTPAQIVLAAGAWSTLIAKELALKLPIQPAKGYSITVKNPSDMPQPYFHLGEARVAVTPMGNLLRFAGTLELAGFDFSINQKRVDAILNSVSDYLIIEGERELVQIWRGMRPCSPDSLPYIGRSTQIENLIVATGHTTLGLSMGPVTGKLVAQIVGGKRPFLNLDAFQIERFIN